jgi:periplasmic divalent cation tolerance protein
MAANSSEGAILVMTTTESEQQAGLLAAALVDEGLAACVQILPQMRSVYRWKGARESALENLLLIKTTKDRFAGIEAAIKAIHTYETPEIISIPINAGSPEYLSWLTSSNA